MEAVTWEALDHPHEEKTFEWYAIVWIAAGAVALISLIFGNILLSLLVLIGTSTLTLLASKEAPKLVYSISEEGIRIGTIMHNYKHVLSYELIERVQGNLLVVDTKKSLTPHLLIPIPDEELDSVKKALEAFAKDVSTHSRGVPLSHTLMELIGL